MELTYENFLDLVEEYGTPQTNSGFIEIGQKFDALENLIYSTNNRKNAIDFNFDVDYVDGGDYPYIQATVYVDKLVGNRGYTIIINHNVVSHGRESYKELFDILLDINNEAKQVLNYLK